MTREEEIERASVHHLYQYDYSYEEGEHLDFYIKGFTEGAKWADEHPKNIWHDASEEPNRDITSKLIYYIEDTDNISIRTLGKLLEFYGEPDLSWNSVVKNLSITKWAYIDDLLPKTN